MNITKIQNFPQNTNLIYYFYTTGPVMTAELSSLLPENGGFIVWVNRAFGPYTSWINSMFGVCNAMTDNALYPIM